MHQYDVIFFVLSPEPHEAAISFVGNQPYPIFVRGMSAVYVQYLCFIYALGSHVFGSFGFRIFHVCILDGKLHGRPVVNKERVFYAVIRVEIFAQLVCADACYKFLITKLTCFLAICFERGAFKIFPVAVLFLATQHYCISLAG